MTGSASRHLFMINSESACNETNTCYLRQQQNRVASQGMDAKLSQPTCKQSLLLCCNSYNLPKLSLHGYRDIIMF